MLFTCFSLSLCFLLCSGSLYSLVVYSDATPQSLLSELSRSIDENPDVNLAIQKFSSALLSDLEREPLNLLFDYTHSVSISLQIKQYCSFRSVIYFSPLPTSLNNWAFLLHPSPQAKAAAIDLYLKHLNWTDFHIFSSQFHDHKTIYQLLSSENLYVISNTADQEAYDDFTGKVIKPSGNWKAVVLSDGQGISKFITSLENLMIYKERCAFVTNSEGSWGMRREGGLSIVEEGLEGATSAGDYEFKAIKRVLRILDKHLSNSRIIVLKNDLLLRYLETISQDRVISSNFSILNFAPFAKVVGSIHKNQVLMNGETMLFPGNVTELNNSPPVIQVSGNLVPVEYDGSTNPVTYVMGLGVLPMEGIINADPTILTNFQLAIHSTDCGQTYFRHDFLSECLERHYDHLGAFYMNTAYEKIGAGHMSLFKENNIFIPHTAVLYKTPEKYDKTIYPDLFIPTADQIYMISIIPYILNSFRWDQILVIFLKSERQYFIDVFLHNTEALNIKIMNDEDHMFVRWSADSKEFIERAKNMAQYLYETKCRILVLLIDPPHNALFVEGLHEYGFQRGDLVIFNRSPIGNLIINDKMYGLNTEKIIPLLDGSLGFFNNEYVGEYGEYLEKKIAELIYPEPTAYTCFMIDSLLLGVHTIDLMLNIGRNYEDPLDMIYFMRQERFTGCSGTVSIDSQGNGRNEISFTLFNFYMRDGEDGQIWKEDKIGNYTIGVRIPLQISRQIIWPKGETSLPADMRKEPKCGFPEEKVIPNENSRHLMLGFSIFYFVFTAIVGFLIWKKLFRFEYEDLTEKKEIWFEDTVIILLPVAEALQYMSLGPDLNQINPFLSYIASVFSLDIMKIQNFNSNDIWTVFYITLGGSSVWILSGILFLSAKYRRLSKLFRGPIVTLAYRMSPAIAKFGFVGTTWILLKLFRCEEGTGSDITSSFLESDCKTFCWQGFHLYIAIFGYIVLLLYTVLSIAINLLTEYLMDYSNVKTSPLFSFIKTVFHTLLVLLSFHLKSEFPILFSAIYLGLFILWSVVISRIRLFNYSRLSFWQKLISFGLCLYFLSMLIYETTGEGRQAIMIVQIILILSLLVAGIIVQYKFFPSLLFRRKGRNFDKLLKFAFRTDFNPQDLTVHKLDYVVRDSNRHGRNAKMKYRTDGDDPREISVQDRFNTVR